MSLNSNFHRVVSVVAAGFTILTLCPAMAGAEQFTFFDLRYTATQQNSNTPTSGHYEVFDGRNGVQFTQPANWTSPIDYTKGTLVVELDAIEKPSEEIAQIDICFLTPPKGYGCRNTTKYGQKGRYQLVRPMPTGFNAHDRIEWTKKITHVQLVTKDAENNNGGKDQKKFFPHTSRIAITFVAPGSTYVLPPGWTPAPGADAGMSETTDAGTVADSAVTGPSDAAPSATDTNGSSMGTGGRGAGDPGSAGAGGVGGSNASGGAAGGGATGNVTGGASGKGGAGGAANPAPVPPPASTNQPGPNKTGPCSMAPAGAANFHVPGALVLFAAAVVGLALRRRRNRS